MTQREWKTLIRQTKEKGEYTIFIESVKHYVNVYSQDKLISYLPKTIEEFIQKYEKRQIEIWYYHFFDIEVSKYKKYNKF